jgi:hypothetical protein
VCQIIVLLTLPYSYFELRPKILDQKFVKKVKFDVVLNVVIQKSDVAFATLYSKLSIL